MIEIYVFAVVCRPLFALSGVLLASGLLEMGAFPDTPMIRPCSSRRYDACCKVCKL